MNGEALTSELFVRNTSQLLATVGQVIDGKDRAIRLALTTLLAEGHLLIEDVPGVGKTMLARTLAKSLDASIHPRSTTRRRHRNVCV